MSNGTHEELGKRISEDLNTKKRELHRIAADISGDFGNLGLETAVWYPERIHTTNLGGIDADSYFGYSRIEGRWGLVIRTIERDRDNRAFVSQRVFTLESCGNVEIVVNALNKTHDLMTLVARATDLQIEAMTKLDGKAGRINNPQSKS